MCHLIICLIVLSSQEHHAGLSSIGIVRTGPGRAWPGPPGWMPSLLSESPEKCNKLGVLFLSLIFITLVRSGALVSDLGSSSPMVLSNVYGVVDVVASFE